MKMNKNINKGVSINSIKTAIIGVLALTIMALAGCASAPVKTQTAFFPPAPEEPKLQFLKGISGARDVETPDTGFGKSLMTFAAGDEGETRPITKPFGLRFYNGKLYVCDIQGFSIDIIDFANNSFTTFTGKGSGRLNKPLNVALDAEGRMYVVDAGRREVVQYAPNGDYVGIIGLPPNKDGKPAMKPADVAVDADNVYILDMTGEDIKVFDKKSGKLLRSIGKYVEGKPGGLAMPIAMALKDGLLYVTNVASGSVVVMDTNGKLVSKFGNIGDGFGDFSRPKGIAVGAEGRIWAADGGNNNNVQIFSNAEKHRLLIWFGEPGLAQGSLNLPVGVTLTADKGSLDYWQKYAAPGFVLEEVAFVGNQSGNTKVSIYGLGHRMKALGEDKAADDVAKVPSK